MIHEAGLHRQYKTMNAQHLPHEFEFSPSHRRALRLRLATALIAASLVVAGLAGLSRTTPPMAASVFDTPAAR